MKESLLALFVALSVTYLVTGMVRKFALAAGVAPPVRDRDVHAVPIPRLGGLAMFAGLCAALIVASELPFMQSIYRQSDDPKAVFFGGLLICLLGVVDDKWGVDPFLKLGGQILAALVMAMYGIQMTWIPIPGVTTVLLDPTTGILLTVLIVVVTINAVNFVDGLDGLAAGMVGIAALAFFGFSWYQWTRNGIEAVASPTLMSAILVGMCLGFLPHNFNPARIFMGDTGSMLIGLVLSASSISLAGKLDSHGLNHFVPALLPLLLPVAVLAVPLVDLCLAVVRRTWKGQSPFAADKQHLHHRLLDIGHSHRRAVLIMYLWAAVIAFGTVGLSFAPSPVPMAVFVLVLVLAMLVVVWPRVRANRRVSPTRSA
ncbi:undecaprenyl/decaprenyl-phosphate alpha-N-acetylglucosaminyl 1-phosphate transferase [Carbonactinospora thermoautotrophica]|uniref:Putative undecaprenyl-phosphate alpha-N-acetylglucosaminyl 1-phosphate transferase n=1 Tax=Carbonactinospora thermoautotrophica TaxID=1469144 RepID=A0A132MNZ7_9ACTN|nr:MraY family glycosyltransferase [Carbonactinospora thermoautotrophica]KWW99513.1 putative undecaprenyl-phosphate alpha-N-acetylglucosaminyl 1-phosphate transferase [Carbonactinospora thermoautotrophica]MCX9191906.1 undecaprenyl/decaprenyl-phosphate alpha-N-acetylglucosaminyl 1-phosphate transferase [Carbonactinospora thermoautotrophica]